MFYRYSALMTHVDLKRAGAARQLQPQPRSTRAALAAIALGAAGLLALTGCTAGEAPSQSNDDASPVGTWGEPGSQGMPSLTFEDEEYSGTDGCNNIAGTYSQDDAGVIDLGAMAATKMFCEGVDTWLSTAQTASVEDASITFFDENGDEVGSLAAASDS